MEEESTHTHRQKELGVKTPPWPGTSRIRMEKPLVHFTCEIVWRELSQRWDEDRRENWLRCYSWTLTRKGWLGWSLEERKIWKRSFAEQSLHLRDRVLHSCSACAVTMDLVAMYMLIVPHHWRWHSHPRCSKEERRPKTKRSVSIWFYSGRRPTLTKSVTISPWASRFWCVKTYFVVRTISSLAGTRCVETFLENFGWRSVSVWEKRERERDGSERCDEESDNLSGWCLADGVLTKLLTENVIVDVVGVDERQLDDSMCFRRPSVRFAVSQHGEINGWLMLAWDYSAK